MELFRKMGRQIERFKRQTQTAAEEEIDDSDDMDGESGTEKDLRDDEPQQTRN